MGLNEQIGRAARQATNSQQIGHRPAAGGTWTTVQAKLDELTAGVGSSEIADLALAVQGPVTDKGGQVVNVKHPDFGATGNGTTDDAAAIDLALDSAEIFEVGVYFPPGTYLIQSSITARSGVPLLGAGSTRSIIKMGASIGQFNPGIDVLNVSNVRIEGLQFDGNKSAYAGATTEHRHCIRVLSSDGNSYGNIMLSDVYAHHAMGDGLYVARADGSAGHVYGVFATGLRCDLNHRNGMSHIDLRDSIFTRCEFTGSSGTSPQAGYDAEPNESTGECYNVKFFGCKFSGNAGPGVQVLLATTTTGRQDDFEFYGCDVHGNSGNGYTLQQPKGVLIQGGEIYTNGLHGVNVVDNTARITINPKRIYNNGARGVYVIGQFNTKFCVGLKIINHTIDLNGTLAADTYDGIRIDWQSGATNGCDGTLISGMSISGNRRPITTADSTHMKRLYLMGCPLLSGTLGGCVLADDSTTRKIRACDTLADLN